MPSDLSRKTFNPKKHYSGVLMQQGRVQLDADWNEQLAIHQHRTETEAKDVIGLCGVPKKSDGFKIGKAPDEKDLTISPGRIYVDGLLCELEATPVVITFVEGFQNTVSVSDLIVDNRAFQTGQWVEISAANKPAKLLQIIDVDMEKGSLTFDTNITDYQDAGAVTLRRITTYITQPDYPNPDYTSFVTSPPTSPPGGSEQLSLQDGMCLVFLDVWQREINALDDSLIREKALGGPDTTTRLKNVWQVKLLPLSVGTASPQTSPPSGEVTCETPFDEWDQYIAPSTGTLNARTKPPEVKKDPCLLPPSAGYLRLENQLYRVEVHTGGTRDEATFKWSRDNATVETTIEKIDGNIVTVFDVGKDEVLGFAGGQWVEIVDEESTLKGIPYPLVQIDKVDPTTREVTMKISVDAFKDKPGLKFRRWDQTGDTATTDGVKMTADWMDLEDGIQVRFSEGSYHPGDYWLIPARTATGEIEWPPFEIPNTKPIPQLPIGIQHHYCRLALIEVKNGAIELREDCRDLFPTLTEICAEDICFDNTACKLPDVETVQDALDRLCAERDLRHHNKHLHGWGIVCGLQVVCGPDPTGQQRRHITIRPGYAIDCEGNDILIEKEEQIDLLEMIAEQLSSPPSPPLSPPLLNLEDGEVCLILELDEKQKRRYRLEKYDPSWNSMESVLSGTLLMDFYNECIQSLVDFVKDEFTPKPGEEKTPVGPTQKRITTFSNLLIQLVNPVNGSFVFLSGEKGQTGENLEDTILRNFYNKLRAKLQSHTFCAMLEGTRQFPDYPYMGLDIATIFGKGFQKRFRVAPGSKVGYAVGASNKINVYDLQKNEMVEELEFPGGSSAVVQDVAFSKDGRQLYAVAILNNKDSMFAVADVSDFHHVWRRPTVICDVLLVTLGTSPSVSEHVYATGKGKGLYVINPQNVEATPTPFYSFNAVGHLVIVDKAGQAFVTATDQEGPTNLYNRVLHLNLREKDPNPPTFVLTVGDQQMSGQDDIAVDPTILPRQQGFKLWVVVDPSAGQPNKQGVILDTTSGKVIAITDLGENTAIRLAYNPVTKHIMVTYEDSYRVALFDPTTGKLLVPRHPVQISPLSIAVAPDGKRVYVLNYASNTISSVPAERLTPDKQIPLKDLVDYRTGVLNAFTDLLGGLLQYLKDCFCDRLLVNCPTCDADDKIYLACISIKNNQVYQVCNFSRRKYVKSFPTVEYWLSVVPIIPLLGKAVETFCCTVLPDFFGKFQAPEATVSDDTLTLADNRLKSAQIRQGVTFVQQTDFLSAMGEAQEKLSISSELAMNWIGSVVGQEKVIQPKVVKQSDIVGQPVEEARRKLEATNVIVDKIEPYDPKRGPTNIAQFSLAPIRLQPGTRVTLITQEDDKVLYYARAEEVPQQVQDLCAEVESNKVALNEALALRQEVVALKNELLQLQRTHQETLAARDQEIANLKNSLSNFQVKLQAIDELKDQVDKLSKRRPGARSKKEEEPPKSKE